MKRFMTLLLAALLCTTMLLPAVATAAELESGPAPPITDQLEASDQLPSNTDMTIGAVDTQIFEVYPAEEGTLDSLPAFQQPAENLPPAGNDQKFLEFSDLLDEAADQYRSDGPPGLRSFEQIANPHIINEYSPNILRTPTGYTKMIIFTDTTTGMPAYCLDYDRDIPSPNSLDGENDFNPETIFDPDTYNGLRCLLLAGYPFETGNGLTAAEAQGVTQAAVWCWTYLTKGYGLNPNKYSAIPGKEHIYEFFLSLLEAAHSQRQPDLGLSASPVQLMRNTDSFSGQAVIRYHNLNRGYTLDTSRLPAGFSVSGYTGANGDVLTIHAPLTFAGQTLLLKDILRGHDERTMMNLFWYNNKNPDQQRMTIAIRDTDQVAIRADIELEAPGIGQIRLIKKSITTDIRLPGAVYGVYQQDTQELVVELVTDQNGEAVVVLEAGAYYLQEIQAPSGYEISAEIIRFELFDGDEQTFVVADRPLVDDPPPTIYVPRTGEFWPISNWLLAAGALSLAAGCGWLLYQQWRRAIRSD